MINRREFISKMGILGFGVFLPFTSFENTFKPKINVINVSYPSFYVTYEYQGRIYKTPFFVWSYNGKINDVVDVLCKKNPLYSNGCTALVFSQTEETAVFDNIKQTYIRTRACILPLSYKILDITYETKYISKI